VAKRRLASKVAQASACALLPIQPSAPFESSSAKLNNLSFRAKRELWAIACFSRDEICFSLPASPELLAVSWQLFAPPLQLSTFSFQLSTLTYAR
jgi:hypothetical protein